MPRMRVCSEPGCPEIQTTPRCPDHTREVDRARGTRQQRGYDAEHPRIDLLRHRSLTVGKDYGFQPVIHTPELVDAVAELLACFPVYRSYLPEGREHLDHAFAGARASRHSRHIASAGTASLSMRAICSSALKRIFSGRVSSWQ